MERIRCPRMSAAEKDDEVWRRWKRGESLSAIGPALERIRGAIHHVVSAHGGVPPMPRTRSRLALKLTKREGNLAGARSGRSAPGLAEPRRP